MAGTVFVRDLRRARELAGENRAGSYVRSQVRERQQRFVRNHATRLLVGWLIMVSGIPITWWLVPSEFGRGLLVGGVLATATATVWHWIVRATGSAPLMMGDQAEQWTAEQVRGLGPAWMLINHFSLTRGDIDHVVIGPAGLFVLETKWSAQGWGGVEGVRRQQAAVSQVERAARQLRLWHDLKRLALPVTPVVVLWGGGARDALGGDGTTEAGSTYIVAGPVLQDWLRSQGLQDSAHGASTDAAWRVLEAHARRRDDREDVRVARRLNSILVLLVARTGLALAGFMTVALVATRLSGLAWTIAGFAVVSGGLVAQRWRVLRPWSLYFVAGAGSALLFGGVHLIRYLTLRG